MQPSPSERIVFVCVILDKTLARQDEGNTATSYTEYHIQHVIKDWFPGAVFSDLTDDTTRLDVTVRKGLIANRNVYGTTFHRADGSLIKKKDYDEDRLVGQKCSQHDKRSDRFVGKVYGADVRIVVYRN